MKTYSGLITELNNNQIQIFGSNPEGRHGKGTAKITKDKYGAIYGKGRGLQGQSYALVTTSLKKDYLEESTGIFYLDKGKRGVSPHLIIENIEELYLFALENYKLEFLIAYTANAVLLNGYTPKELAKMFYLASLKIGEIPDNIIFNNEFYKLIVKKNQYTQFILYN